MISSDIELITEVLGQGGVIAYPTETVFGIGCLPSQASSIERLLDIKRRSPDKGLILLAENLDQLTSWIGQIAPDEQGLIETQRARATSWVVPADERAQGLLTGGRDTLAIRLCSHPLVKEICRKCNSPLISTSANLSGQPPATCATEIIEELEKQLDLVVDAPCLGESKPSQIIDLKTQRILRD